MLIVGAPKAAKGPTFWAKLRLKIQNRQCRPMLGICHYQNCLILKCCTFYLSKYRMLRTINVAMLHTDKNLNSVFVDVTRQKLQRCY